MTGRQIPKIVHIQESEVVLAVADCKETWNAALARTARAWANKCIFEHNIYSSKKCQCHPNFTSVGENIWVGSHQAFYVADAIKLCGNSGKLNSAEKDYSYKIVCAVTLCKEVAGIQNAANFVCSYSPGKPGPLLGSTISLN
ncbi:GLIPR1-like protein 2 [Morus bassanus]